MTREEAWRKAKGCLYDALSEEEADKIIKALEQEPCEMTVEKYRQRMIQAFHNADCGELIALVVLPTEKDFEHLEWLLEKHYKAKPEPCGDAISRQAVLKAIDAKAWEFCDYLISKGRNDEQKPVSHFADNLRECISEALPPVTPQYTDAEIQKMQDLESAEIQKAYEIGKAEGSEVLEKIRVEIDEQYDRVHPYNISCAEGLEMALDIIDKYKASPTGEEVEE